MMNSIGLDILLDGKIHGIEKGIGSFLMFYFSKAETEFILWIYLSKWIFIIDNKMLFSSESEDIESNIFENRKILCSKIVKLEQESGEVHLHLSSGVTFEVWPYEENAGDDTLLMIFEDEKCVYEHKSK